MTVFEMYKEIENTSKWASSTEQIIKSYDRTLERIKKAHPNIYSEIKEELYVCLNGYHFTREMLSKAYEDMINDNGTKAPKWSVEETSSVAEQYSIEMDTFNACDWNYAMNMIYSDYVGVLGDSVVNYVNMADKFLHDKDASEGKALRYYFAMKKAV